MAKEQTKGKFKGGKKNVKDCKDPKNNRKLPPNDREDDQKDNKFPMSFEERGQRIVSKPNDPVWYALDEALLRDAASIAYSNAVGTGITLQYTDNGTEQPTAHTDTWNVPGIGVIELTATPGYSADATSAINIAAKNIYSFVRHANSGSANYESPDLMLYILAMGNLYAGLSWMQRVYGVARLYSQKNRYYPKSVLRAMGVDFDSIQNNLADFRYYINTCALKLSALSVPKVMPLFSRWTWLNSGLYLDSENAKAQLYIFNLVHLWKFDATGEQTGGSLVPQDINASTSLLATFEDIRNNFDAMLGAIIYDEDMNIMSGDIMKAYGKENLYEIASVDEGYQVLPEFNLEVLSQIQNTTMVGRQLRTGSSSSGNIFKITQENGVIKFAPTAFLAADNTNRLATISCTKLFNMYKDDPTPADTMVASRLSVIGNFKSGSSENISNLVSFGSELCNAFVVVKTTEYTSGSNSDLAVIQLPAAGTASDLQNISAISVFDYHPLLISANASGEIANYVFFDSENITTLEQSTLAKMHETAILSELGVPLIGMSK